MLPEHYYVNPDALFLSRDLLGKKLCTKIGGEYAAGIICETEAYCGPEDRASHAYGGRRTTRNETMYHRGGVCYVYLCYGIHHLFNIVTNEAEIPHAILVRSISPIEGISTMLRRRKKTEASGNLSAGPGTLTQALGITTAYDGWSLRSDEIWIEEGVSPSPQQIVASPRIGIDYAGEHALLPWRFQLSPDSLKIFVDGVH